MQSGGIKTKPKKKPEPGFGFSSEKELFLHLWNNSNKRCAISGKTLEKFENTTRFWSMFAHILSKGAYPEYRLNPENVWIVHPDIHDLYDNRGSDKQEASGYDFDPLFREKERLKQQYYREFKI